MLHCSYSLVIFLSFFFSFHFGSLFLYLSLHSPSPLLVCLERTSGVSRWVCLLAALALWADTHTPSSMRVCLVMGCAWWSCEIRGGSLNGTATGATTRTSGRMFLLCSCVCPLSSLQPLLFRSLSFLPVLFRPPRSLLSHLSLISLSLSHARTHVYMYRDALRREVNASVADDGTFWMSMEDWRTFFNRINICQI